MNGLFDQMTALPTLVRAFDRVEENHGGPGIDGVTVEDFGAFLENNLIDLRDALRAGRYAPKPLLRVYMAKADGSKRPLSIPCVRDRVVQTAAALVLNPLLDPQFEDSAFGYRPGRSVQQAVRRLLAFHAQGYRWVVDADITAFFDEIDHDLLLAELARHTSDRRLLDLIKGWLEAEVVDGRERFTLTRGVPQGSPISPLLSNLYLDRFDEALSGPKRKLVRYADDFVVLCKDQPAAEQALELTADVLAGLKLRLKPEKTAITHFDRGFRFLGVQFIKSLAFRPEEEEQRPVLQAQPLAAPVPARESAPDETTPAEPETALALALKKALASSLDDKPASLASDAETDEDETPEWEDLKDTPALDDLPVSAGSDPLIRTLYLLEQGSVLSKEDQRFIVSKDERVLAEVPVIKVDQVLIYGNVHVTTPALHRCLEEDIPVVLLSSRGKYRGVVENLGTERVLLHREQFARADDAQFCLGAAREMVHAKLANSRLMLRRYQRSRAHESLKTADGKLKALTARCSSANTLDELRGLEGAGAAAYFDALRAVTDPAWDFRRRARRPPPDPVNAVLSYTYTLLFFNVYALTRSVGLNPHVGFLHPLREGHPALASDLMEEFRAVVADAVVWPLFWSGTLEPGMFSSREPELGCRMSNEARKLIIRGFETKMNSPIRHPAGGQSVDYRRLIAGQARLMARAVRGEETYRGVVFR